MQKKKARKEIESDGEIQTFRKKKSWTLDWSHTCGHSLSSLKKKKIEAKSSIEILIIQRKMLIPRKKKITAVSL